MEIHDDDMRELAEVEELMPFAEDRVESKIGWVYALAFAAGVLVGASASFPLLAGLLAIAAVLILWEMI
jgi:hypothetical protein